MITVVPPAPAARHLLFSHAVRREEGDLDLAVAALLIAEEEYPGLDVSRYVETLDRFARPVRRKLGVPGEQDPPRAILAINEHLFERERFSGNEDNYYDPRNSYLNEVIDRRTGIPITLSLVYMEVAARVGLPLVGVGFPGHFLVKHVAGDRQILIDPFFRGRTLDADDLGELLKGVMGPDSVLERGHIEAVGKHEILSRILRNLRGIFLAGGDLARALSAVERLCLLDPHDDELRSEREEIEAKLRAAGG